MNKYRSAAIIAAGVAAISFMWAGPASASEADCQRPTIIAEPGAVTYGTDGRDIILGTAGNDEIYGYGGDDVICAGAGNDYVAGMEGRDEVYAGTGDDTVWLPDFEDDFADGGAGYDSVTKDSDPLDRVIGFEEIAG